jgi:nitrite reductase/ring-hydroxylating ferredoxin subunit
VHVELGAVDEFTDRKMRILEVEGRELGILRWGDSFYAFRNVCPHIGARVCTGAVRPVIKADRDNPWKLVVDDERPVIICPWHRWPFEVRDGRSLIDRLRLKTYPVSAVGGRVVVELPPPRRSRRTPPAEAGA